MSDRKPDYCHDDDWEYTQRWDEIDELMESHPAAKPVRISTLYRGPVMWAVNMPVDTDGDGETDDYELRFFDSEELAIAALEPPK